MLTRRSGTFLSAAPTYCIAPAGPGGSPWRDVGPVINKIGREIHLTDMQVFPVHEFLGKGSRINLNFAKVWSGRWESKQIQPAKIRRYHPLFSSIGVKWSQNPKLCMYAGRGTPLMEIDIFE